MIFSQGLDSRMKLQTDVVSNISGITTTTRRQYKCQHSSTLIIMQHHTTDIKLQLYMMHVLETTVKQQQQIATN